MKNNLLLKDISLVGILTGLIIFLNIFSSLFPILMGYSLNLYFIVLSLTLIIIKTNWIKYGFFLIIPFILLLAPNIFFINIMQVFFEYFLGIWCFFPFIFGDQIIKKIEKNKWSKKTEIFIFGFLFIVCWLVKLLIHIIAGYLWWTNYDWRGSIIINTPIILLSILLTIPIFILIFSRTIECSKRYYQYYWNDTII